FQAVLRVLKIRLRPFYNTRHTFISIALTLGCNQKWIAEQMGTSIAMIQEHYGRYIRDDGDRLLRAYLAKSKNKQQTETLPETYTPALAIYWNTVVRPTEIDPLLRVQEPVVIPFTLRAG